ncbi:hypothetical protein [Flavobacterium franklandianum]|uniref:Lipocalin-like domain-containing protein n=1 Tax=Flavobacterium franklandianum TaxID=2594430 RepID=A0A553CJM2_9FLAO|nr:hypothetical protein [Flavobacterium franklandianum]TRX20703.1 hypothetical protein FNW17_10000 [Flavobacterium franklandianum]
MKAISLLKGLGLLFLTTIMASCSEENTNIAAEKNLIGTWSWVSTSGGFAFHINDTPATTGKNIDLKFTGDGKYLYYTNGILSSEGTYQFSTQKSIVDGTYKKSIDCPFLVITL